MIFIFIVHIVLCIIVTVLLRLKIIKTREHIVPILYLIPFTGPLIFFMEQWLQKRKLYSSRNAGYDRLEIDDLRFQKIVLPTGEGKNDVVPLEEAMEINNSYTRRSLIMDILKGKPEDYVPVLESASLSDDTELSHYATTSMIAIQTRYEARLGELELRMRDIRDAVDIKADVEADIDEFERNLREKGNTVELVSENFNIPSKGYIMLLDEYIMLIDKYMDSGLISGAIYDIYQVKYDAALVEMLGYVKDIKKYWLMWVTNRIETGRLKGMDKLLELMRMNWPDDEKCYMVYMAYAFKTDNDELASEIIKTVEERQIYLSKNGKEWYDFWRGKYENPFEKR